MKEFLMLNHNNCCLISYMIGVMHFVIIDEARLRPGMNAHKMIVSMSDFSYQERCMYM